MVDAAAEAAIEQQELADLAAGEEEEAAAADSDGSDFEFDHK